MPDLFGLDLGESIERARQPKVYPVAHRAMSKDAAVQSVVGHGRFPQRATEFAATLGSEADPVWTALALAIKMGGVSILYGDRGVGKTVTACRLGIVWHARGYGHHGSARYWRLNDLLSEQKRSFGRDLEPAHPTRPPMDRAFTAGLLVLDEVHETTETTFDLTELARLIDKRYADYKPTLLVSNTPPTELVKRLGPSIIDRCREGGALIEFKGKSKRGTP